MRENDENEIIRLAQNGDKDAENTLVIEYTGFVDALTRAYFLTGADKDDITQIGLLGLVRAIRSFDFSGSFKAYAAKCVRNAVLDAVREANARKNMPLNNSRSIDCGDDDFSFDIPSDEPSPEESYIAKEAEKAFFDALSSMLGETDLAIIKLYLSSMPYKEISERLGVTAKKVDNTIYNAKKKLEGLLNKKPE